LRAKARGILCCEKEILLATTQAFSHSPFRKGRS